MLTIINVLALSIESIFINHSIPFRAYFGKNAERNTKNMFYNLQQDNLYFLQLETAGSSPEEVTRRQLQKQLESAWKLNEFRSKYMSIASHELGTPLSNIRLCAELCRLILQNSLSKGYSDLLFDKLEEIITDTDRISGVISEMLLISRSKECVLPFHPERVSIDDFVTQFLRTRGRKIAGERCLEFIDSSELATVFIDLRLMESVLENVIGNAVKYSSGDSLIKISTKVYAARVLLEIRDFGIGISDDDIPMLFDEFFRARNVGEIPGCGLGLSIVKTYVAMNNGTVEIESVQGKGTTVKIFLDRLS